MRISRHICVYGMAVLMLPCCGRFKGSSRSVQTGGEVTCDTMRGPFGGGSGTVETPYLVCSSDHLFHLSELSGKSVHVSLESDLNIDGIRIPSVSEWTGVFEGNAKVISNYRSDRPLFSSVRGVVRGVHFKGLKITGLSDEMGAVARTNFGVVQAVSVTGEVNGYDRVGGIVGANSGELISTHFSGDVNGGQLIGGIVGYNAGFVSNASFSGNARGVFDSVGGIVGRSVSGRIARGSSTGIVSGRNEVGGIAGNLMGQLENSFSVAAVSGSSMVGGLVGYLSGSIFFCYADAATTGTTVGGLIASTSSTAVVSSFWNLGRTPTSAGGQGKTIEELQNVSTYSDWDFILTWEMSENSLPALR